MPQTIPNRATSLRQVSLFTELSEADLKFLSERMRRRRYAPGDVVFSEGEVCEGLFVIESGEVKIFKAAPSGREQVLAIDGPGSSVAELPVFDGDPYPASALAVTEAVLLHIQKQDLLALCRRNPEVALKVLRAFGSRLRKVVQLVEEISFKTVRHRLATVLYHQAQIKGHKTKRGTEFSLEMTHEELAAQIGTVRELVSRNLSRLEAMGVIRMEGKTVIVPDLKALEAETRQLD